MRTYKKKVKTKMNLNKMRIESNILGSFLRLTFLENFGLLRSTGYNAKYRIAGASVVAVPLHQWLVKVSPLPACPHLPFLPFLHQAVHSSASRRPYQCCLAKRIHGLHRQSEVPGAPAAERAEPCQFASSQSLECRVIEPSRSRKDENHTLQVPHDT